MLKLLLISVPFLFVLGSVLHFVYGLSKQNKLVALLAPVNESIFEHSKLLLIPLILFWVIAYFFIKNNVNADKYFFAMLVSIITSIIVMISFYYTYKEMIGNSYIWVDIFDLLLSLFIGQVIANHFYVYSIGIPSSISIIITVIIFIIYCYLTYNPPKIPLFYDKKNKIYGINKKA